MTLRCWGSSGKHMVSSTREVHGFMPGHGFPCCTAIGQGRSRFFAGNDAARAGITAWRTLAPLASRCPVDETPAADRLPAFAPPDGIRPKMTQNTGAMATDLTPGESREYPEVPGYEILGVLGHGGMGV